MSVLTTSVYADEETYEIAKIEERQLTREEAKIEPYVELTPNGYVLNDNPSFFLLSITTAGWQQCLKKQFTLLKNHQEL